MVTDDPGQESAQARVVLVVELPECLAIRCGDPAQQGALAGVRAAGVVRPLARSSVPSSTTRAP